MVRDWKGWKREYTGEDSGGETKRGWRNMVVEYEVLRRKFELDNEGGLVYKYE